MVPTAKEVIWNTKNAKLRHFFQYFSEKLSASNCTNQGTELNYDSYSFFTVTYKTGQD